MSIPIRWIHMDAMGHVNNTVYFRCLQRADQIGTIYAAGCTTTIWVDFPSQKAVHLPEWLREKVSV